MDRPSGVTFADFDDDHSNSMVRSLHLDADDEPTEQRRFGVGSRTNSVRFDESAKQGPWGHTSRSSIDLPRTSSGLSGFGGGHPMFERTVSHKSDGRQSSAGQSASGRANSLMMDNGNVLGSSPGSDVPIMAPGLFILGSVPAIVRCWLSTNFKHDALLYAAVCTGSYKSYLDNRLLHSLGLTGQVRQDLSGDRKVRVPMYLPEAVPQHTGSRSSSPAPQLPSLTIDFTVIDKAQEQTSTKAIQIFIGSDVLRTHSADILFSSNSMTLYDDDRSKLSIPFVRPENDETFKSLLTSSAPIPTYSRPNLYLDSPKSETPVYINGNTTTNQHGMTGNDVAGVSEPIEQPSRPEETESHPDTAYSTTEPKPGAKTSPNLTPLPKLDTQPAVEDSNASSTGPRNGAAPAIWGNWRREGANGQGGQSEWGTNSKATNGTFQRGNREQGIRVLKPNSRQPSRSATLGSALPGSPTISGQSRFFDDGKRRTVPLGVDPGEALQQQQSLTRKSTSGETSSKLQDSSTLSNAAMTPIGTKPRSTNPIGQASAFNWLNSGGQR